MLGADAISLLEHPQPLLVAVGRRHEVDVQPVGQGLGVGVGEGAGVGEVGAVVLELEIHVD